MTLVFPREATSGIVPPERLGFEPDGRRLWDCEWEWKWVIDVEERVIGGLVVRIDRLLCVGFEDCIDVAPKGLVLDDQGIAVFTPEADGLTRDQLLAACRICPVDAITVLENGAQVAP